jgi:hypothetical protein
MKEKAKGTAYKVLELERKLAAYEKVHDEEIDELRQLLSELKEEVLTPEDEGEAGRHEEAGASIG